MELIPLVMVPNDNIEPAETYMSSLLLVWIKSASGFASPQGLSRETRVYLVGIALSTFTDQVMSDPMTATILQVLLVHIHTRAFSPADSHETADACQPPHRLIPVKSNRDVFVAHVE